MSQDIVSVIIPAYNAEAYISECLESVLSQTYENIEIFVVNDGSTDNTAYEIQRFCEKDSRVQLINTENRGVSAARNTGMHNCSPDGYLMFVDADDRMMPTAIEDLKRILDLFNADIVDGYAVSGRCGERKEKPNSIEQIIRIWDGETTIKKCLADSPEISSCWVKLYRKSAIEGVCFDEDIRIHEDRLFLFRCALKKPKFVSANEYVYQYNMNSGSASKSNFSEKYFDILTVAQREADVIRAEYPHLCKLLFNLHVKANMIFLRVNVRNFDKKYWKFERQCLKEVKKNKQYFRPTRNGDLQWFKIITRDLYYVYKGAKWIKTLIKK